MESLSKRTWETYRYLFQNTTCNRSSWKRLAPSKAILIKITPFGASGSFFFSFSFFTGKAEATIHVHMMGKLRRSEETATRSTASSSSMPFLRFIAKVNFKEGFEKSLLHNSPPMYLGWLRAEDASAWEKTKISMHWMLTSKAKVRWSQKFET